MNTRQLLLAIKTALLNQCWGSSSNKVFAPGSVVISAAPEFNALATCVSPIAVIRPLDATADPEHGEESDIWLQRFDVEIVTVVPGDTLGENPLMGANVPSANKSEGKGIFQVEEELDRAIATLHKTHGITVYSRGRGAVAAALDESIGYVAWRNYNYEALISTAKD